MRWAKKFQDFLEIWNKHRVAKKARHPDFKSLFSQQSLDNLKIRWRIHSNNLLSQLCRRSLQKISLYLRNMLSRRKKKVIRAPAENILWVSSAVHLRVCVVSLLIKTLHTYCTVPYSWTPTVFYNKIRHLQKSDVYSTSASSSKTWADIPTRDTTEKLLDTTCL